MNVQEGLLRERIDPHLTNDVISRECSEALGERVRATGYESLSGGCWNRVIGVTAGGHELVLKMSPHRNDEKVRREFLVLDSFHRLTDLRVPRALLLDVDERFMPGTLFVMTRIPGLVMHRCFGALSAQDRGSVTRQIAEDLAALHTHRAIGFGGMELPESDRETRWADFWLPRFDTVIREVTGIAPDHLVDRAREIRSEFPAALDIGTESVMTHYDVWSGNVMIDVSSGGARVSGYVDVTGHYADYARELSFAMLFGVADQTFFDTYRKHHELDEEFALRASIYNLKMNLRHVQMYPLEEFYQQGAADCLETIARLV